MTIPKSYEALAADLASEKILSKTLIGQKEAYMMLADHLKLDLATWKQKACEAAEREAALREELGQCGSMAAMIEDKEWAEHAGSCPVSSRVESAFTQLHNELSELRESYESMRDRKNSIVDLQQRLTVAEQRAADLKKLLCDVINEAPTGFAALKVDIANRVNDALKPAAEGEGS